MHAYFNVKPLFTLFVMVFIFAGCSSPRLAPLPSDAVIIAFGDSLTAGYGVNKAASYPQVLQELTGLQVINAGVSGETSTQGLKRLPVLLEQYQPQLVILFEGGNDVLQKRPEEEIKQNLTAMIQLIKQSGADVLLIGVPEKKLFGSSLPLYDQLASELDVPLEEDIVANLMKRPSMKSDFVHFNSQGYAALAQAIYEKLQETGAIQE